MSNDCPSTLKDFTHNILWWDFYFLFTLRHASCWSDIVRQVEMKSNILVEKMCGSFIAMRKFEDNHFCRVWWNIKGRFESDYLMCVISGSTSLTFLSCLHIMRTSRFSLCRFDLENKWRGMRWHNSQLMVLYVFNFSAYRLLFPFYFISYHHHQHRCCRHMM